MAQRLIELKNSGKSWEEVGKAFGLSYMTVRNKGVALGYPFVPKIRRRPLPAGPAFQWLEEWTTICKDLRHAGHSWKACAKHLGVAERTVRKHCRQAGLLGSLPRSTMTLEQEKALRKLNSEGLSQAAIAEVLELSPAKVSYHSLRLHLTWTRGRTKFPARHGQSGNPATRGLR